MKKLLPLLFLITGCISVSAQIPNAGFENWHAYATGEYPDFWTTSDSVAVALGAGNNAYKGTDSYEGTYCLHLKSVNAGFVSGPGIATNGIVNLVGANFVFSGGSPDTARSRYLSGQYMYSPKGPNDAGLISVFLLRNNAGNRDTIAAGITYFTDTVNNYAPFNVEIQYRDFINQPDTCLIIIQSSRGLNDPGLAVNTELIIDSLNFSGFVGINELNNIISSVNVYPSPASDMFYLDITTKNNAALEYQLFDTRGRLVLSSPVISGHDLIQVGNLSEGQYILRVSDKNKNNLYSKNISISR